MRLKEYEENQEKKAHGNSDFPFNIYLCTIPLDFAKVQPHWHNDMEIIYVKKGRGRVMVDLKWLEVEQDDILLISPGMLHAIEQKEQEKMEYENIIFSLDMLMNNELDRCTRDYFRPLVQRQKEFPTKLERDSVSYLEGKRCLDTMDAIGEHGGAASELAIKGLLFQFFYVLFHHFMDVKKIYHDQEIIDKLKELTAYVEQHYQEKITIEEMADLCGFSSSHFMKFFKKSMGTSFIEYLNEYRLQLAAKMLAASNESVSDIAGECGFENLSHFNRKFKKMYQMTPREFRKADAQEEKRQEQSTE